MKKSKLDNKLLLEFTNIFLNASKELQSISLWKNENQWNELFHNTLKELKVVYGYFVEFDPEEDRVKYFIQNNSTPKLNNTFKPPIIPYFPFHNKPNEKKENSNLYGKLVKGTEEGKFDNFLNSPKLYQHLPVQPRQEKLLISDECLNCYIPCQIKSNNDYYVVLFDEIAFYQYAYLHFYNQKSFFEHYKTDKKLILKYLLKFAVGIELKLGLKLLSNLINLSDEDCANWNKKPTINQEEDIALENSVRKKIETFVDNCDSNCSNLHNAIGSVVKAFINKCQEEDVYKNAGLTDAELICHISRFDIPASFDIIDENEKPVYHDVFVFPLYTETTPFLKTKCLNNKVELPLHSPILLVLYIKTLHIIHSEQNINLESFDENLSSIDGFQLTKEIAKLFADRLIQEDYLKNVIRKETRLPATRAAIAQVMARNMSHNIGSHVLNKVYKILLDSQDEEDLKRAAHLYEFIQKRMEFIANGVNASFQSSHFLFKEILPAYLQQPEEKRLNLKSLFDNISGNQLITSENISFKIDEGVNDIQVSIPNGTLGFHALYTLFENIIRNSVKHNQSYPADNKLIYTIKVEQNANGEFSDYYKISVTDNFGEINKQKGLNVDSLNNNMNQPILSNGSLRPNYWGLLEMKICATYLLGLPIDLIDSANKPTGNRVEINGIEQVFPTSLLISQDSNKNLVHTFYLQKPKVAAVIGSNFIQNEIEGIELVTNRQEFDKLGSKHLFAVFEDESLAKEHETKTNQRSIFIKEKANGKTLVNENLLWNKFAEQKGWDVNAVEIVNIIDCANDGSIFPVIPNKRYIIFDYHQDWWEKQKNKELVISDSKDFLYYEYVNSLSPTTQAITKAIQLNNGTPSDVLKTKIFEAAFTDIIVLDERIQKNYGQEKLTLTNPQPENPLFSNLFIPPYEGKTDLDKATTSDILEWEKTISGFKKDYKLNYLIIHRSITGKDRIDIDKLMKKLKPDFTIFVSGGGTPPNLKDCDFYLPFDVLNYCLGSNPSKFALVGILKSLRKIKK